MSQRKSVKRGSLMDRALAVNRKPKKAITAEEIEVAFAWLRDELSLNQVSAAFFPSGVRTGGAIYRVAMCLREAHRQGQIQIAA